MNHEALEALPNDTYWFLFHKDEILVKDEDGVITIPCGSDLKGFTNQPIDAQSIGIFHEQECFIASISKENIPAGFSFKAVRPLYGNMDDEYFWFACRAFHLFNWMKTTKFCGCCGSSMNLLSSEIAMKCSNCGHLVYPRISPAIIVAVVKENQLLLARSKRFPPNRYSVIAGFVEPGETIEECVIRELKEEVGIEVENIKYFGSQPWSFPDSLMVAFTAKAVTEEIKIDNDEIVAADWFTPHNLPDLPDKPSVGRQLIDWFTEKYKDMSITPQKG
ncbi:NAD(+) diphosphatase [Pelosinus sp. sgz500959]|uniref:NAD(+) diphosphatase n=1 Tax=Pelosinus sp. sgz500959 TaxID=3242472 RepID=UPI003671F1A0